MWNYFAEFDQMHLEHILIKKNKQQKTNNQQKTKNSPTKPNHKKNPKPTKQTKKRMKTPQDSVEPMLCHYQESTKQGTIGKTTYLNKSL